MKTIIVALFGVLLLSSAAFAVNDDTSNESLNAGGGALADTTASASISIGLSPKVYARYVTDGTTEVTAQWYAIATVHPGGNVGYATAQDVNNIYMQKFVTGDVTTTITSQIQTAKAADQTDMTPEEKTAANLLLWEGKGWALTAPK